MIGVIAGIILAGFIAFGVTEFTDEPSPSVAGFLHDVGIVGDYEPIVLTSDEIYKRLERYGNMVYVVPGEYEIPRIHTVWDNTFQPYCSARVPAMKKFQHGLDMNCQAYSNKALENMGGFAWGVAWSYGVEGVREGHMVNIGLVENYDGEIKIMFYEPNGCFITEPPNYMRSIVIGVKSIDITTEGIFWEER